MTAVPKPLAPYPRSGRSRQGGRLQSVTPSRPQPLASRPTRPTSLALRPNPGDIRLAPTPQRSGRSAVRTLPVSQPLPAGVQALVVAQHIATPITFLLVAATAVVYGWTVYTQQLWSQQYQRMEALQRQERQLVAADEVLKNDLARQALNPGNGLTTADLSSTVFLEAPPALPAEAIAPITPPPPPEVEPSRPFAY